MQKLRLIFVFAVSTVIPVLMAGVVGNVWQIPNSAQTLRTSELRDKSLTEFYEKVHTVPITTEHGLELYQRWIDQALSSLFAAVANRRLILMIFCNCVLIHDSTDFIRCSD